MWPLFCNEVALSYDQEERIRTLQKELLSNQESWLHRHTGAASEHILQSSHAAIANAAETIKHRERMMMDVLTPVQQAKFLVWIAEKRKLDATKLATLIASRFASNQLIGGVGSGGDGGDDGDVEMDTGAGTETGGAPSKEIEADAQRHEAANLYILNHQLSTATSRLVAPTSPKVLPKHTLAKFARRPAFESLATVDEIKGPTQRKGRKMSKDSSSGNLKRCSSEISMSEDMGFMKKSASGTSLSGTSSLTPEAAQTACATHVYQALGNITNLIPSNRLTRQHPVAEHQQTQMQHHTQVQPAQVVSSHHPIGQVVKLEPAGRVQSPTVSTLLPGNYSNELGFYGNSNPVHTAQPQQHAHQHQPIVPAPVQSTSVLSPQQQGLPHRVMTNRSEVALSQQQQQQYVSVPIPEPVPIAPISSNLNTIPTIRPTYSQQQQQHDPNPNQQHNAQNSLSSAASAPLLSAFRKIPSPINMTAKETKEGLADDIGVLIPMDDIGFWNVSNQMADDSLFDLTEEDWAIGEGAFIE